MKVYENRLKIRFENEEEMILKILKSMKEFPSRPHAVKECNGSFIKIHFG